MLKTIFIGIGVAFAVASSLIWISNNRFDQQADALIHNMLDQGQSTRHLIVEEDLSELPAPVQNWIRNSGVLGQPIPRTIRIQQEGEIRLGPDQSWMPFHADQYYTIDPPAFLWRVSASMAPGIFVRGVDSLSGGRGAMQMLPLSLFKVVDASGPTIDQGTALRYLQEIIWFPAAALSETLSWEAVDEASAQATLTLETLSVTGTFFFDQAGQVIDFQALRYRDDEIEPWSTPMRSHGEVNEVLVPTEGEGVWGDDGESFVYIRVHLIDVEYDVAEVYPYPLP